MANRFFGAVGYAEPETETSPGVWTSVIVEKNYYGDIERNSLTIQAQQVINDGLTVTNSISIVADAYANENVNAIRYVRWARTLWMVEAVEVRSPRLILRLGGVYNGPRPA